MNYKNTLKNWLRLSGFKKIHLIASYCKNFYNFVRDYIVLIFLFPFLKKTEFEPEKIKKILIIRIDRVGDMIISTPAIRAVRNNYPDAEIHLLASIDNKDLIINNPNINKVLVYKNDSIENNYDMAIALNPGYIPNYLTFKSGAKIKLGYTGQGGNIFLTHSIKDDRAENVRHEIDFGLELVALAGCETDNKETEVSITEEAEIYANNFFLQHNLNTTDLIIAVHPGASQEYIRWSKEGFAKTADVLMAKYNAKVLILGSKSENQLLNDILSLMKAKPIIINNLSLSQVVSVIKRCNIFLGNCSGPMHIAAALKIPVVVIMVSAVLDNYHYWGPRNEGDIILTKNLKCSYCHPTDCTTYACIRLVSAEEVISAAENKILELKKLKQSR